MEFNCCSNDVDELWKTFVVSPSRSTMTSWGRMKWRNDQKHVKNQRRETVLYSRSLKELLQNKVEANNLRTLDHAYPAVMSLDILMTESRKNDCSHEKHNFWVRNKNNESSSLNSASVCVSWFVFSFYYKKMIVWLDSRRDVIISFVIVLSVDVSGRKQLNYMLRSIDSNERSRKIITTIILTLRLTLTVCWLVFDSLDTLAWFCVKETAKTRTAEERCLCVYDNTQKVKVITKEETSQNWVIIENVQLNGLHLLYGESVA